MIAKFALVIFLFYQSGVTIDIANARIEGRYSEEECLAKEVVETKTLPLQPGNDARWQYAKCVQVES